MIDDGAGGVACMDVMNGVQRAPMDARVIRHAMCTRALAGLLLLVDLVHGLTRPSMRAIATD